MNTSDISKIMNQYIDSKMMAGGALIVRKDDELVYHGQWGYEDIKTNTPITEKSMYRLMSMTKSVVAVAIMRLVEDGKMDIEDKLSKYIPEFSHMRVANDPRYQHAPKQPLKHRKWKMMTFNMNRVKSIPSNREITIRDLLSHASGLELGTVGRMAYAKMKSEERNLKERAMRYTNYVLDFHPGTGTGYSPVAGYDILSYVIELASGMSFESYIKQAILEPLGMSDTCFFLSEEQNKRLVRLYKHENGELIDVTGTKEDNIFHMRQSKYRFAAGCGGLYGTITDFDKFSRMLCNEGFVDGVQILKPESVKMIRTEAQEQHLEPVPGMVWGLSVRIRQNPEKCKSFVYPGTYGWSGAFGTHYFVCPDEKIEAVFMTNVSNTGGSASPIVLKVEELVFGIWGSKIH